MKLKDITPETMKQVIDEFHETVSRQVTRLMRDIGNESGSIPKSPRKLGTHQFPYFFAADLDQLARYALGGLQASRPYMIQLCDTVERALFESASGERAPAPEDWHDTPLGFVVLAARARAAVRKDGGDPLTPEQVRAVTGMPEKILKKAKLLNKSGASVDDVRAFLEENGLAI